MAKNLVEDDQHLRCRTVGHSWDEFTPIDLERPAWGWRLSLRCIRCTTERHDIIDINGNVSTRRYRYAEGYRGLSREIRRPDLRRELARRLKIKVKAGAA